MGKSSLIMGRRGVLAGLCLVFCLFCYAPAFAQVDPLPSWNDGAAKKAIIEFVARVTREGNMGYVPPDARIAVFDNDGTLWCEHPFYFQLAFAFDRVRALAPQHPEWKDKEPFKSLIAGDVKAAAAAGEKSLLAVVAATHSGMTTDEFADLVKNWIATAKHPRFHQHYNNLIYQPMLEVMQYLRANGFKTFIVSGGGADFMRPWTEKAYGIPPEQVVGSSGVTKFELRDGKPVLIKTPAVHFIDDGPGKPVGIHDSIGRRPIIAFGNSDGDLQMLQYVSAGTGARLVMYVHHDDAEREYAYDRHTEIGRLDKGLDEAKSKGWPLISMKNDWKTIFPGAATTGDAKSR